MRKIGGILLAIGLGILVVWGLYWFFRLAFLFLPLPVKIAIAAIAIGLIILLASLGRERYRASREERGKVEEREKEATTGWPLLKEDNLMKLFSENWDHIRHMERYRMLCLNIYVVILGGIAYALSTGRMEEYFSYIAVFLVFFTIINWLIAFRIELIINKFVTANNNIRAKFNPGNLNMDDWAPIRTEGGPKFRWIFRSFYGACLVGIIILIALH